MSNLSPNNTVPEIEHLSAPTRRGHGRPQSGYTRLSNQTVNDPEARPKSTGLASEKLVRRQIIEASIATERQLSQRRLGAIVMSAIGILLLVHRRLNYDSVVIVFFETLSLTGMVTLTWYLQQKNRQRIVAANDTAKSNSLLIPLICLTIATPWIINWIVKSHGFGNGVEIVMLSSLAWGSICASLLARRLRSIGLSVICSGFLSLFLTFIADAPSAVWFSFSWAVVCMWWLIANQWERMSTTAAYSVRPARGQRVMFLILGLGVFLIGALSVNNRIPILRRLTAEIMPTSGGTSAKDSSARRGVGNGDAILAAKKHATSFGAVDTDLFLDSDKPSLFDLVSEELGEPKKKTKSERAQALNQNQVETRDQKYTESNRASGGLDELNIDRQLTDQRRPSDDLICSSLMFWQGQAGALLAVKRFEHFDGVRWFNDNQTTRQTPIEPVEVEQSIWFRAGRQAVHNSLNPYVDTLPESLKFTRYSSAVIPTRVGMQLWSVDQLNDATFFAIDNDDCLKMPEREQVPEYTVVRMINSAIDLERAEQLVQDCAPGRSHRRMNAECNAAVNRLAHQYSGSHPRGWAQVQSIVTGVRDNFELASRPMESQSAPASQDMALQSARTLNAEDGRVDGPPETESDALAQFLTLRRGPDYMFATAAALMLEHMGYRTRLVVGFYCNPDHYLSREREYAIQPGDLHTWVELDAGHEYWIPLEPSPGYVQPRYTASLWYYIRLHRWQIAKIMGTGSALLVLMFLLRATVIETLSWILWPVVASLGYKRQVAWLTWLIDLRSSLAGLPRIASTLPREHLLAAMQHLAMGQAQQVSIFLAAADQLWFGGRAELNLEERKAVSRLWLGLTSRVIKRSFSARNIPEAS